VLVLTSQHFAHRNSSQLPRRAVGLNLQGIERSCAELPYLSLELSEQALTSGKLKKEGEQ
jgi:hypothetical protein